MNDRLEEIVNKLTEEARRNLESIENMETTPNELTEEDIQRIQQWEDYLRVVKENDALSLLPPNIRLNKENIENSFVMKQYYTAVKNADFKEVIDRVLETLYKVDAQIGETESPILRCIFHQIEEQIIDHVDNQNALYCMNTALKEAAKDRQPLVNADPNSKEYQEALATFNEALTSFQRSDRLYRTDLENLARAYRKEATDENYFKKTDLQLWGHRKTFFARLSKLYSFEISKEFIQRNYNSIKADEKAKLTSLESMMEELQEFANLPVNEREEERKKLYEWFSKENDYVAKLEETSKKDQQQVSHLNNSSTPPSPATQDNQTSISLNELDAIHEELLRLIRTAAPWNEIAPYYYQLESLAYGNTPTQEKEEDPVEKRRAELEKEIKELTVELEKPTSLAISLEEKNIQLITEMIENRKQLNTYYRELPESEFTTQTREQLIEQERQRIDQLLRQKLAIQKEIKEKKEIEEQRKETFRTKLAARQEELSKLTPTKENETPVDFEQLRAEFQQGVELQCRTKLEQEREEQQKEERAVEPVIERPAPTFKETAPQNEEPRKEVTLPAATEAQSEATPELPKGETKESSTAEEERPSMIITAQDDRVEIKIFSDGSKLRASSEEIAEILKIVLDQGKEQAIEVDHTEEDSYVPSIEPQEEIDASPIAESPKPEIPPVQVGSKTGDLHVRDLAEEGKVAYTLAGALHDEYEDALSKNIQQVVDEFLVVTQFATVTPDGNVEKEEAGSLKQFMNDHQLNDIEQVAFGIGTTTNPEKRVTFGWINGKDVKEMDQRAKESAQVEPPVRK